MVRERPAVVQAGRLLRGAPARLLRRQRRRVGRPARADGQARLPAVARRRLHLAPAHLPLAAARRRLRHRRLLRRPPRLRHRRRLQERWSRRRTSAASGSSPTSSSTTRPPTIRGSRRRARAAPKRDWYVWSDTDDRYKEARIIFLDTEVVELDLGPDRRRVLLAPLLLPSARPELRQPRGAAGDARTSCASGSTSGSTASGSTPCRTSTSARGRTARTSPRRTST